MFAGVNLKLLAEMLIVEKQQAAAVSDYLNCEKKLQSTGIAKLGFFRYGKE